MRRALLQMLAASVALCVAAPLARADDADWPRRQVTFLQPYGPGTALDAATSPTRS